jgi:hypothetical protein
MEFKDIKKEGTHSRDFIDMSSKWSVTYIYPCMEGHTEITIFNPIGRAVFSHPVTPSMGVDIVIDDKGVIWKLRHSYLGYKWVEKKDMKS